MAYWLATLNTGEATLALIARGEAAAVAGSEELQKSIPSQQDVCVGPRNMFKDYFLAFATNSVSSEKKRFLPRAQFWTNFWRENPRAMEGPLVTGSGWIQGSKSCCSWDDKGKMGSFSFSVFFSLVTFLFLEKSYFGIFGDAFGTVQ